MIGVDDISYIYVPLVIGELPQRSSFHLGTGALHHREHLVIQLKLIMGFDLPKVKVFSTNFNVKIVPLVEDQQNNGFAEQD